MDADFFESTRTQLVTYVHEAFVAQFPELAIVFDNGPFDWNNPPKMFVHCCLVWDGGDQINLALQPKTRFHGLVECTVHIKLGAGSGGAQGVMGWFANHLAYKNVGPLRLQAARPDPIPSSPKGWAYYSVCVPFHCDTQ